MALADDSAYEPQLPARQQARRLALESFVSLAAVAVFLWTATWIRVYPLDRLGQISGIASLAFRVLLFGLAAVAALVIANRARGGVHFDRTTRIVCAALAGVATAMIAGGILVALRGTPWGLNGRGGDAGALANWALGLQRGEAIPPTYPPLSLHVLANYSSLIGQPPEFALKDMQILGTALFGPFAYIAWRFLLPAPWALGVGVICSLPLVEPYKPFPNLVLVVFVPLAILYLRSLRTSAERSYKQLVVIGAVYGALFGLSALMYSGWFQWAAPGVFIATLLVFPWKSGRKQALALLGTSGVVFGLLTAKYLAGLLFDPAGKIADNYVYFDVRVEPLYFAAWRNDTPGVLGNWPPIGELGGVGLYTLLLAIGLGVAVAIGRRTTLVIGATAMIGGAWLARFFFAKQMWATKLVQLYPRTTPLLLYATMALAGFAIYWLVRRWSDDHPLRGRNGVIGAFVALLLVFASAGSATADRFMPVNTDPPGGGWLTYNAHATKWGEYPRYKPRALQWIRRTTPLR